VGRRIGRTRFALGSRLRIVVVAWPFVSGTETGHSVFIGGGVAEVFPSFPIGREWKVAGKI
jgi:hypothetical protein